MWLRAYKIVNIAMFCFLLISLCTVTGIAIRECAKLGANWTNAIIYLFMSYNCMIFIPTYLALYHYILYGDRNLFFMIYMISLVMSGGLLGFSLSVIDDWQGSTLALMLLLSFYVNVFSFIYVTVQMYCCDYVDDESRYKSIENEGIINDDRSMV